MDKRVSILGSVTLSLMAPFMLSSSQRAPESLPEAQQEQKIVIELPDGPLASDPNAGYLGRSQYEPFDTQVIEASYDAPVLVNFVATWDSKFNNEELIPKIDKLYAPFVEAGWKQVKFDIEDGRKTMVPDAHGNIGRDWTEAMGVNSVPYMLFVYREFARHLPEARIDNVEKFLAGAVNGLNPANQPPVANETTPRQVIIPSDFRYFPFNMPQR